MNSIETRRPTKALPEPMSVASVGAPTPHPTRAAPEPNRGASGGDPKQPGPADYSRLSREYLDAELQAASQQAMREQAEATQIPEARQAPPSKRDRDV